MTRLGRRSMVALFAGSLGGLAAWNGSASAQEPGDATTHEARVDAIFSRFKAIVVPEMNMGQMTRVLRSEHPDHNFISYPKVTGQPFLTTEIVAKIESLLQ